MASPASQVQASRSHQRVPVDVGVSLVDNLSGHAFTGRGMNISIGGVFVGTEAALPFGCPVTIHMCLPGSASPSAFEGIVRWRCDGGIGVQFQTLSVRQTRLIADLFVERMQLLDGQDVAWVG